MKKVAGVLIIILGILLALFVGLWVMFIGGIVQVVESVKEEDVNALGVAVGIARCAFASLVGFLIGAGSVALGGGLYELGEDDAMYRERRKAEARRVEARRTGLR